MPSVNPVLSPAEAGVRAAGGAKTPQEKVDECNYPRNRKRTWGAIAIGSGFVAGTSGVGTLATIDKDSKTVAYTTGIVAAAAGAVAAIANYVQGSYDDDFKTLNCTQSYLDLYGKANP